MAFTRLKKVGHYYYVCRVESYRNEEGKVRQRTLENYGRVKLSRVRQLFGRKPSEAEIERTIRQNQ